jgi:carbon monoxide dehydrogenase subunit G
MQLEHEFTVPVGVDDAWRVLLDIERIAPCLPGATVTSVDGDEFTGTVKVKVGPITVAYNGSGRFLAKDDEKHVAVIEASGKETRGAGTARATVTATLYDDAPDTRVVAVTDLAITGRPAQFGRSVLADVGAKLVGQFADCLAEELAARPTAGVPVAPGVVTGAAPAAGASAAGTERALTARTAEPIDLISTAAVPVLKRLAPLLLAAAAAAALLAWRRRSRRS